MGSKLKGSTSTVIVIFIPVSPLCALTMLLAIYTPRPIGYSPWLEII
jgi:hypothetical protein